MKRNETVLVYAVTGLLLVILMVAVVFGGNPVEPVKNPGSTEVAKLPGGVMDDLMNSADDDAGAQTPPAPSVDGPAKPDEPGPKGPLEPVVDPAADGGGAALESRVVLPAEQLEITFGTSHRVGNYRKVLATSGATLETLVVRWCGSKEQLSVVETLNEALIGETLGAGQEVLVPWVAPEILLAADESRRAEQARLEFAKGEPYVLKRGDSLWKIAERRVSRQLVPAWIEQFKKLNPDLQDLGRLREGQKVRLPRG